MIEFLSAFLVTLHQFLHQISNARCKVSIMPIVYCSFVRLSFVLGGCTKLERSNQNSQGGLGVCSLVFSMPLGHRAQVQPEQPLDGAWVSLSMTSATRPKVLSPVTDSSRHAHLELFRYLGY